MSNITIHILFNRLCGFQLQQHVVRDTICLQLSSFWDITCLGSWDIIRRQAGLINALGWERVLDSSIRKRRRKNVDNYYRSNILNIFNLYFENLSKSNRIFITYAFGMTKDQVIGTTGLACLCQTLQEYLHLCWKKRLLERRLTCWTYSVTSLLTHMHSAGQYCVSHFTFKRRQRLQVNQILSREVLTQLICR